MTLEKTAPSPKPIDSLPVDNTVHNQLLSLQKQNWKMRMVIGILSFLLILVISWTTYSFLLNAKVKQLVTTPTPLTSSIPQPTNQTKEEFVVPSDWKTFEDKNYEIELKYPNFIFTKTNKLGHNILNNEPIIKLESGFSNYLKHSINAFLTLTAKNSSKSECDYIPKDVAKSIKQTNLNGTNFTVFTVLKLATDSSNTNTIYRRYQNNTCYELVTTIHESSDIVAPEAIYIIDEQKNGLINLFDQILSTFRFTE